MKAVRFLIPLWLGVALWGCSVGNRDLDRLPIEDRIAYLLLLDQLNQLPRHVSDPAKHVNLCVGGSMSGTGDREIEEVMLKELREHMPEDLSATLMRERDCREQQGVAPYAFPDGAPAWSLWAYRRPPDSVGPSEWSAGITCGGLCGWGNGYRIDTRDGLPSPRRVSIIMS